MSALIDAVLCAEARVDCEVSKVEEGLLSDVEKLSMQEDVPMKASLPMELSCCAICLSEIRLEDYAAVKGCEHSFCANCILQWASYKSYPWCPQCRLPFSSLYLYKTLDGRLVDYMTEESVCLLLRAPWYKPCEFLEEHEVEAQYQEEEEDDDDDEYYTRTLRLGNRRWGENGFVRGGRIEARPVVHAGGSGGKGKKSSGSGGVSDGGGGSATKGGMGRRAKRAQKREMVDEGGGTGSSSGGGSGRKGKGRCC